MTGPLDVRASLGGWFGVALALVVSFPSRARAQGDSAATMSMPTDMTAGPLGIPETRMGSGTSWLPDASPMHASHFQLGIWTLMAHGAAFLQYDAQGGPRGDDRVGVVNWAMVAASRVAAGGRLELRGMLSAEPWTVGARGYPLLLQSGESYQGAPLHDRQHPHDLFVELAALYERPLSDNLAVSLYLAPVGEPAVGPVAFPHRPSAAGDPLAPLAHHWQDATHISYGVVTAGIFTRSVKLEGSAFNGREPDEHRTDFDYSGRRLDSYGARLTVNPGARWSLSAWYAYLRSPEELHPDESLHRLGASALFTRPVGTEGQLSSAFVYGANVPIGTGRAANSFLMESNLDLDGMNTVFGRAEYVRKGEEDLVIPAAPPAAEYDVGSLALGYLRELWTSHGVTVGAGARGAVNFVPTSLEPAYASRTPVGFAVYVSLRPKELRRGGGMTMPM